MVFSEKQIRTAKFAKIIYQGEHLWLTIENVDDEFVYGKLDSNSHLDPTYREGKYVAFNIKDIIDLIHR